MWAKNLVHTHTHKTKMGIFPSITNYQCRGLFLFPLVFSLFRSLTSNTFILWRVSFNSQQDFYENCITVRIHRIVFIQHLPVQCAKLNTKIVSFLIQNCIIYELTKRTKIDSQSINQLRITVFTCLYCVELQLIAWLAVYFDPFC